MEAIVSFIINELNLDDDRITNIYNYGSWVYGTHHEKSDRDFLFVIKDTTDDRQKRLKFHTDFDYFHSFDLRRVEKYDVTIHSCANFELLLEKNYMLVVECVFYPEEFTLRNQIDYRSIYLAKYYNPLRLKQVTFFENYDSLKSIVENNEDDLKLSSLCSTNVNEFLCRALQTTTTDEDRVLKQFFHGLRYLDIGEQLIRTKSIYDFKRASHVLSEIRELYLNNHKNIDFVVDYLKMKSEGYKLMINQLLPNLIDVNFEVHITVENRDREHFFHVCRTNGLEPILIHPWKRTLPEQLTAVSYHRGRYPDIIEQVKTVSEMQLQGFQILRIKIKCLGSTKGLPENDLDKILLWDEKTTYFEFRYKVVTKSKWDYIRLKRLCTDRDIHLADSAFEKVSMNEWHYILTKRLFNVGRTSAFIRNENLIRCLKRSNYSPLEVHSDFVVFDSNIDLDKERKRVMPRARKANTSSKAVLHPHYHIYWHYRKVRRFTDR